MNKQGGKNTKLKRFWVLIHTPSWDSRYLSKFCNAWYSLGTYFLYATFFDY